MTTAKMECPDCGGTLEPDQELEDMGYNKATTCEDCLESFELVDGEWDPIGD